VCIGPHFNLQFRRFAVFFLLSFICFLNWRCLEQPRMPSWDTEVTIPLINETYNIADLLKVSNQFRVLDDSIVQFYSEFNIDTVTPKCILSLLAQNYNLNLTIAQFQITNLYIGRLVLSLNDIVGSVLPESTIKTIIPSFTQTINNYINLPDIQRVELSSGIWKFRIHNLTNLDFDTLILNSPSIPYMRATGIGANSTSLLDQKVDNSYLENPISVQIGLGSPGSFPDSIYVSGLDSVVIELTVDSLRLSSGILRLPETRAENQTAVNVNSDQCFRIDSLELASGTASLNFFNSLPTAISINLAIEVLNYNQTFRIESNGSIFVPISLAGLKLGRTSLPYGSNQEGMSVVVNVNLTSEPSHDFVTLEHDDGLIADYSLSDLNFRSLLGELIQPIYISSPEKVLFSFPGQGNPGIKVSSAAISLHLINSIGFPAAVRFRTYARKDNGDSISRIENIDIQPGYPGSPSELNITIPVTNIMNFGARQIKFSTDIRVYGQGRIDANSFARGNGCLSTPLRIAFNADTTFFGEYRFSLDKKDRQTIIDWQSGKHGIKVIDAEFSSSYSNHFPIGFNARLVVAENPTGNIQSSDSIVIPLRMPSGVVAGPEQNQYCTQATDSTELISLNETNIGLFTNPSLSSHLVLCFLPSDTVTIRAEDYLNLLSRASIKLRVNEKN
jgi:hypothetical protein